VTNYTPEASLTYSLRCRVASEPPRWRGKGTSRGGVCFAADWVALEVLGTGYRRDRGPIVYGPAGISAAAESSQAWSMSG
jgi:hypothetical protein